MKVKWASVMLVWIGILTGIISAQEFRLGFRYNASQEKELEGTIVRVEKMKVNTEGWSYALILHLQTENGEVRAFLGPEWYLEQNRIQLRENMKIKLHGAPTVVEGTSYLVVREMEMEKNKIRLRDEDGLPLWSKGKAKGKRGKNR